MSDREGFGGDDEHTLPKATVFKLISGTPTDACALADRTEMLPEDLSCAKDTKEIIVDCCVGESIHGARRLHLQPSTRTEQKGQTTTRSECLRRLFCC